LNINGGLPGDFWDLYQNNAFLGISAAKKLQNLLIITSLGLG